MTTSSDRAHAHQVLYIESEPRQATLMRAACQLRPHLQLLVAENGARATAMAPWLKPSLLLVDQRLPDCLGSELVPLLRLRFGWDHVPAIAVTAAADRDAAPRGAFAEIWCQPLDMGEVLGGLDRWLPDEAEVAEAGPPHAAAHGRRETLRSRERNVR